MNQPQIKNLEREIFQLEHQIFAAKRIIKDLIEIWQTFSYDPMPCPIESRPVWIRCPYCKCEFLNNITAFDNQGHAKDCPIEQARKLLRHL